MQKSMSTDTYLNSGHFTANFLDLRRFNSAIFNLVAIVVTLQDVWSNVNASNKDKPLLPFLLTTGTDIQNLSKFTGRLSTSLTMFCVKLQK